jgi:MFS family permease
METIQRADRAADYRERAHPLINQNYALLWTGRAVSIAGDFIFNAGLVVWIGLVLGKGHSWAPLAVSGVLVAATLPAVVVGPAAGVLADRWNKRRTMLWTDALRLALMAALVVLLMRPALPLGLLLGAAYGGILLVNTFDQFFRLSMVSLIPAIVPEHERSRALGLGQASSSLAMIAGPPIAAPLVLIFGIRWALFINAVSFLVSYLAIRAIDSAPSTMTAIEARRSGFTSELLAGLRILKHTRPLLTLMLAFMIAMVGGAALNTLDVFFVTHNLHTPGSWYGLLDAVFGVGAVLGAVLAAAVTERLGAARAVWLSLVLLGALVLVYARLAAFAPAAALLFVCGAPMAALQVSAGTLIMQVTPKEMIARVSSMMDPAAVLAMLLGTALAGYLDGAVLRGFHAHLLGFSFGPVDTIFTGAGVLVLLGGLAAARGFRSPCIPEAEETAPAA